jgi:antitoxin (DNA-binding transcriptional repressor) of toxin-antitoxin stability system
MKTLSPTKARQNLTAVLDQVKRGEDIGILHNGTVYALRVVAVHSQDLSAIPPIETEDDAPSWAELMAPVRKAAREARACGEKPHPNPVLEERNRRRR